MSFLNNLALNGGAVSISWNYLIPWTNKISGWSFVNEWMNWSKIQIWSCRKCCFTIPLSFYYCWKWPPWPFFWIPSLDAILIFVSNRTRHHWYYSDPNTVQRVGNLSRSMASRILNYAKNSFIATRAVSG